MSYSIYIGRAKEVRLPDAPVFSGDSMTGNSNGRHPAYGSWGDFVRQTGLSVVFGGPRGLMRTHPGRWPLRQWHLVEIRAALEMWRATRPTVTPGWCECAVCDWNAGKESPPHDPLRDPTLARLIWLEWWCSWALRTLKNPVVKNS